MKSSHATLLVGLVISFVSLFSPWINYPLGHDLSSWKIPLLGSQFHYLPRLGPVLFILVVIAAYSILMGGGKRVMICGLIFSLIATERVFQLGLSDAEQLNQLIIENNQLNSLNIFNANFSPINSNAIPNLWTVIPTNTLLYRFEAGWYFLSLGWYWAVIGGLAWFIASLFAYRHSINKPLLATVGLGVAGFLFIVNVFGPLLAGSFLLQARNEVAAGNSKNAAKYFRFAFQRDHWHALQWDQQVLAGSCDQILGRTDTEQYRAWYADYLIRTQQTDAAHDLLKILASHPGPFGTSARNQLTSLLTTRGSNVYKKQAYGAASNYWQRALQLTPAAFDANAMFVRSLQVQGAYKEVIRRSDDLILKFALDPFIANAYSDKGDAFTFLRDYRSAKTAYSASYKLDEILNYRTLTALVGP